MTAGEMINLLKKIKQDKKLFIPLDGGEYGEANHVIINKTTKQVYICTSFEFNKINNKEEIKADDKETKPEDPGTKTED